MRFGGWAFLLTFLVGCSGYSSVQTLGDDEWTKPIWPAPPEKQRIRYLFEFNSGEELGLDKEFSHRVRDLFSGSTSEKMIRPYSIAARDGLIAVADPGRQVVHVFETSRGVYRLIDQSLDEQLVSPIGVAITKNRLLITDSVRGELIILDLKYRVVKRIEDLQRPTAVVWAESTNQIFLSETLAHRLLVFDENGNRLGSIGGRGTKPGEFNYPTHLALRGSDVVVNDTMNFRIQLINVNGQHARTFGIHGDADGQIAQSKGIALDSDGHIYVAEGVGNRIQIFDLEGGFLMSFGQHGNFPGGFNMPAGLAIEDNRLYVCDSQNGRVQVFQYLSEQ